MRGRAPRIGIDEAQVDGSGGGEYDGRLLMKSEGKTRDGEWGGMQFWVFEGVGGCEEGFLMVGNETGEKGGGVEVGCIIFDGEEMRAGSMVAMGRD